MTGIGKQVVAGVTIAIVLAILGFIWTQTSEVFSDVKNIKKLIKDVKMLESKIEELEKKAVQLDGNISLRAVTRDYTEHYVRHQGTVLKISKSDGSGLFEEDATFKVVSPMADRP